MRFRQNFLGVGYFFIVAGTSACSTGGGDSAAANSASGVAGWGPEVSAQASAGTANAGGGLDAGGVPANPTPPDSGGGADSTDRSTKPDPGAVSSIDCEIDSDCPVIPTRPMGCALVSCDSGHCKYVAADADGDGVRTLRCQSLDPETTIAAGRDCDDANPLVSPLGWDGPAYDKLANGCGDDLDNDCSGKVDDGVTDKGATCTCSPGEISACSVTALGAKVTFPTLDPSGRPLGNCRLGSMSCLPSGGWSTCVGTTLPMDESCGGNDNDCDGVASNVDSDTPKTTWLCDADSDWHLAKSAASQKSCDKPMSDCTGNWVVDSAIPIDDCDDTDPSVYPGATEHCDGKDHDCDGKPGNGAIEVKIWSFDTDNDQYRRPEFATIESCQAPATAPANCASFQKDCPIAAWRGGSVALPAGDCDDNAPNINPGVQVDLCDGIDYNCDGSVVSGCSCDNGQTQSCGAHVGFDGRGACKAGVQTCVGNVWGDCVGAVGPAAEKCGTLDLNCNGLIGDADKAATDMVDFYCDADSDGFLAPSSVKVKSCVPLSTACGGVWRKDVTQDKLTDCDDSDKEIHPGAPERCNLLDDDCDKSQGLSSTAMELSEDADGDGFASTSAACTGGNLPKTDCFDGDAKVYPGQTKRFADGYCVDPAYPHWCGDPGFHLCTPGNTCTALPSQGVEASYDFNCDGTSTPMDLPALQMTANQWESKCSAETDQCSAGAPEYLSGAAACGKKSDYVVCGSVGFNVVAGVIYNVCGAVLTSKYVECL